MSTKSQELAAALVASLQEDLSAGGAVAGLLVLPMIRRAADLQWDIQALDDAAATDKREAAL